MILILGPIILAGIGFFLAVLFFLASCLIAMGVSGIIMNKIYSGQNISGKLPVKGFFNICAIVLGIACALIPIAYTLYSLIVPSH